MTYMVADVSVLRLAARNRALFLVVHPDAGFCAAVEGGPEVLSREFGVSVGKCLLQQITGQLPTTEEGFDQILRDYGPRGSFRAEITL